MSKNRSVTFAHGTQPIPSDMFQALSQAIAETTAFQIEPKLRRVGELWESRWIWQAKYKSYTRDIRCPYEGFETVTEALEDFIQQASKEQ